MRFAELDGQSIEVFPAVLVWCRSCQALFPLPGDPNCFRRFYKGW